MKLHSSHLKWIAMITMTIDHIGAYILPDQLWLRMIGRLSFPIYAFLIAEGYVHTRNRTHFALRLFGFGMVTQLLFMMFDVPFVNVLFTFFFGVMAMICYDKGWSWAIAGIVLLAMFANPDYSYYGVFTVLLFYHFRSTRSYQMIAFGILTLLFTCMPLLAQPQLIGIILGNLSTYYGFFVQLLALFSIPFLLAYDGKKGEPLIRTMPSFITKYFFYIYYPLHIIILVNW